MEIIRNFSTYTLQNRLIRSLNLKEEITLNYQNKIYYSHCKFIKISLKKIIKYYKILFLARNILTLKQERKH